MLFHYLYFYTFLVFGNVSSLTSRNKRQQSCRGPNTFQCKNGECIAAYSVCDGEINCKDGTDETQTVCAQLNLQCPSFAFRCTYGACIDRAKICDKKKDCADGSDELLRECSPTKPLPNKDVTCPRNQFKCTSGQCIDAFSVCDGVRECEDGSDETITQCVNIRCPDFSFQCAYGACIDKLKKCNGVQDCNDASDEDEELCRNESKTENGIPVDKPPVTQPPFRPTGSGGCYLPDFPLGGTYAVENCPAGRCSGGPGALVPSNSVIKYECYKGFILSENLPVQYCGNNGLWTPQSLYCKKQCNPIRSDSMVIQCSYLGEEVRCDRPLNPGTKIRPRCKNAYKKVHTAESYTETKCLDDGTLEKPLFRCEAVCGKRFNNVAETTIINGSNTAVGEYPWHAGLYRRAGEEEGFEHICGGTIINQYAILTAAHCIYIDSEESIMNANDLKIAVGKYSRSWATKDPYEKRYDVREIIPQREYRGLSNSYAQDIAIIDLVVSIELTELILPACLDWDEEKRFVLGEKGTVVGWGLNEEGKHSTTLMVAQLPYYDFDSCRSESVQTFKRFITYDKFCAGYKNGVSVASGDSGGGLTFEMDRLHFVYGIVSLKQKTGTSLAVFTNVTKHIEWVRNVIEALRPYHSK